jgi:xylan 1,4-beta-xylosidase
LFHDDDGRHWLVTLRWETRDHYEDPGTIVLEEFDTQKERVFGPTFELTNGGTDRGCVEAPHIYKKDGYYYLMTAEGGTGYGHSVVIQRSKTITGPYESDPDNPIITSTPYYYYRKNDPDASRFDLYNPNAEIQKAGHGSLVETENGEWFIAHLSARPLPGTIKSILGRETSIQKVEWTKDGWLKMVDGSNLAKKTTPGITGVSYKEDTGDHGMMDHFDNAKLDIHLLSPYSQIKNNWVNTTEHPGWARIYGKQSFYSRFETSLLACRADAFNFITTTKLEFHPEHFSQSAGMVLYYDNKNWIFLRLTFDEHKRIPVLDILKAEKASKEEIILEKRPIPRGVVELKIVVSFGKAQFSYKEKDNSNWQVLLENVDISYMSDEQIKGFTGLMIGIGAWDSYRHDSFADFDFFKVEDEL